MRIQIDYFEDANGVAIDPRPINALAKIYGLNQWPGRVSAMDEICKSDPGWRADLYHADFEHVANVLMLVRFDNHPRLPGSAAVDCSITGETDD